MNKHLRFSAGTILAIALLTGCGSGGGGSSTPTNPSPSAANFAGATSTGAVVDGIIKNGEVVVNELDASGNVLRQVGNATTDANGQYAVTIGADYAGGPLDFVLTGNATTTMVCDVLTGCGLRNDAIPDPNSNTTVDFGEEMNVDGLKMEAIIAQASAGDTLSVNITPFTTAAANRARNAANIDAAAVNAANSAISNLLGGLDIVTLQPVDLTDPQALAATGVTQAQITYAVLASAIGKLAFAANGNANVGSLTAALDKLASSVAGDNINATGSGTSFSLQEIVNAAVTQFPMGLTDQTGVLTQLQNTINTATAAGGNGLVAVVANANAGNTDIAKAKALVQEIRTWGVSLANPGAAADAFSAHLDAAGTVVDPLMGPLTNSLSGALLFMIENYQYYSGVDGDYPYDFSPDGKGTVSITNSGGTTTITMNGTVYSETVENLTITFTTPAPAVSSVTVGIAGKIYTTDSSSAGVSLSIDSGTATVNFDPPFTLDFAASPILPGIDHITSAGLKLGATIAQINVANPVSFSGSIEINDAKPFGSTPNMQLLPASVKLTGTLADNADSVETTINGSATYPDGFDPAVKDSGYNVQGTVSVAVTVQLDGLPEAQLTATANKTGNDSFTGDVKVILAQDGETITMTASRTSSGSIGNLTFDDTAGASLVVAYSSTSADTLGPGSVKVGDAVVGEVTEIGHGIIKVSYIDGTFETLQ